MEQGRFLGTSPAEGKIRTKGQRKEKCGVPLTHKEQLSQSTTADGETRWDGNRQQGMLRLGTLDGCVVEGPRAANF